MITFIEIPNDSKTEEDFYEFLQKNQNILGKGTKIIRREFKFQQGRCDILAKRGEAFLIAELKVNGGKAREELRRKWLGQLMEYVAGFKYLASVFNVKPEVLPYLIVAIPKNQVPTSDSFEENGFQQRNGGSQQAEAELNSALRDSDKFAALKAKHLMEINRLRAIEKETLLRVSALERELDLASKRKEVRELKEQAEKLRLREEKPRQRLTTHDCRAVYLTTLSEQSIESELIGRIEGERFIKQEFKPLGKLDET